MGRPVRSQTYHALHKRLRSTRGPASIRSCSLVDHTCLGPIHWSNYSGLYLDIWDFWALCTSHHRRFDGADASHMHNDAVRGKISASLTGVSQGPCTDERRTAISAGAARTRNTRVSVITQVCEDFDIAGLKITSSAVARASELPRSAYLCTAVNKYLQGREELT